MNDFLLYFSATVFVFLVLYALSYWGSYHVALFLFKVIMPRKAKHEGKWWFEILVAVPFAIGFLLDIWWNVVHFSFELDEMNRFDDIHRTKAFWPDFSKVKGIKTLYKITLTERLQLILDTYPVYSQAYIYAVNMKELLDKYDKDHLVLRKRP